MKRRPRVFWALNHTTLAKSECALLEKLGYEVLTPKVCPKEIIDRSGSVDHSFDRTLTIPAEDLAALNAYDFYASEIEPAAMRLINLHFDAVFVSANLPMMESFRRGYGGIIVFRAFGREQKKTYASLLGWSPEKSRWQGWLDRLLRRSRQTSPLEMLISRDKRFVFAGCYHEVIQNEPKVLRQKAAFLPIGLPAEIWSLADAWTGGDERVMFVCPVIHSAYYGNIYAEFKTVIGDLPYAVYGNQTSAHEDPNIVGFLPRDEYDARMRRHAAMFYHSSEPCHLHYHPLEAVAMGVPLVYMAGGILERLGGAAQPGLCRTPAEATEKLRRILAGDRALIDAIRSAQPRLLDEFRDDFVETAWRRELPPGLASLAK